MFTNPDCLPFLHSFNKYFLTTSFVQITDIRNLAWPDKVQKMGRGKYETESQGNVLQ